MAGLFPSQAADYSIPQPLSLLGYYTWDHYPPALITPWPGTQQLATAPMLWSPPDSSN